MADTILYPQPSFFFQVDWDKMTHMRCSEVSGLDVELDDIEYRNGTNPKFNIAKMSGIRKSGNLTIKKAVFKKDARFFEWLNQVKMNVPKRVTVTISLLDEGKSPVMVWTLLNAWPKKVSSPDMEADASEVAIEEIEIVYEELNITDG